MIRVFYFCWRKGRNLLHIYSSKNILLPGFPYGKNLERIRRKVMVLKQGISSTAYKDPKKLSICMISSTLFAFYIAATHTSINYKN